MLAADHPGAFLYNSCMPHISDQAMVLLVADSLDDTPSNFEVYEPVGLTTR
jgi:hypothetical protein